MRTGPVPPKQLPRQSTEKVMLMAARFQRAATAHSKWATTAKVCVDFFEGRQWTEQQLAALSAQGRKGFQFNIIAPLVRLILGYQSNNKSDITFKPGNDALSTQQVAEALTRVEKAVAIIGKLPFVDTEVFMDGILTGRGFYRSVLEFEDNDLGELRTRALDPFFTYIDPDADTYNLDSAAYIQVAKYVSIDEIEASYGKIVGEYLRPFTNGGTPIAPASSMFIDEITPERYFGGRDSGVNAWWDSFGETMGDFVDTHRKTIRILETEHKVTEERDVIIDLETGDKRVLPADYPQDKLQKLLLYGEMTGNPLTSQRRLCQITHWTTTCGDLILYDRESIYGSYSITPFFPYFRRGHTRSPIADMLDPQMEKNKRRTAEIEAVSKLSNGGWKAKKGVLNPAQKAHLRKYGALPGFLLEYDGLMGENGSPEQIQPAAPPISHERLEAKSDEDIRRISGINESALGEIDKVQSGRAIEARQRQAVISLQVYLDNFKHSKELLGGKRLEIYQQHYLEPRLFRILGEDGKEVQQEINGRQFDPGTGAVNAITNNITLGKYACVVDEQPLSATFANAQFEEMMSLLERLAPALGPSLPAFADLIIDASSLPRKTEWIERLASLGIGAPPPQPGLPAPGAPMPPGAPQQVGGPPAQPQLMPPG